MIDNEELRESLQKRIDLAQALELLENNSNFKKVVINGFLTNYCLNAAWNCSNPIKSKLEGSLNPNNIIQAVGCFKKYLQRVREDAQEANEELDALNSK